MTDIIIGFVLLLLGFNCYFSEKKIPLAYKSLQLNSHPSIWKWTNRFFGRCMIGGSLLYFIVYFIMVFIPNNIVERKLLSLIGLCYIVISFIATEIYAFIKKGSSKQE